MQETPDRGDVQETSDEDFEDAIERTRGPQSKGKQKCNTVSLKRKHSSGETPGMTYRVNEGQHPRQKRFKLSSGETPGKVCRACEGFHSTQRCYYLFPEKAPEEWTPKPHIQSLVEQNLKDDSTLEEEIKR